MKFNLVLHTVCEKIIYFFSVLIISVLVLFNVFVFSSVAYNASEKVSFERNTLIYILLAIAVMAVLIFLNVKWNRDKYVDEKKLFRFFVIAYMLAGIYLILNIDPTLRADALILHEAAGSAAGNDFSFLAAGENLYCHPYQLGMVTYERILGIFSKNTYFIFLMNLLEIIGINFFSWKLSDLVFLHNRKTNLFTIVFSFCFLPQFFFLTFAYGLIPGFFCMMGAFYFQQKYFAGSGKYSLLLCGLFAVTGTVLKGNFIIGVIAMAILFFIRSLNEKKIKHVVIAVLLIICVNISEKAVIVWYESESGLTLSSGAPNIMFIAMGTDPGNRLMAPGWHNGYDEYAFEQAGLDPKIAADNARDLIKSSMQYYREHPKEAVKFFGTKIASVWCDPMFQSVWSGPLQDCGQNVHTIILESLYHGGTLEKCVSGIMKSYLMILLFLAAGFVISNRNKTYSFQYALLYMVGGFLIHIVWEGKSQYVYPYIFILIPGCAHELTVICDKIKTRYISDRETKSNLE